MTGEELYQKAMSLPEDSFIRQKALLEKSLAAGYQKAACELYGYYYTGDSYMYLYRFSKGQKRRDNVKAYQMLRKALDSGVVEAHGCLCNLTNEVDFTVPEYSRLITGEKRDFDWVYWMNKGLLEHDPRSIQEKIFRLFDHGKQGSYVSIGWLYTYKNRFNPDEKRYKEELDLLLDRAFEDVRPTWERLVISQRLFRILPSEHIYRGCFDSYFEKGIEELFRTGMDQDPEDCEKFWQGLKFYYGMEGEKQDPLSALEIFQELENKGYKELTSLVSELKCIRTEAFKLAFNITAQSFYETSFQEYKMFAEDDIYCMYVMAMLYQVGINGSPPDEDKRDMWYNRHTEALQDCIEKIEQNDDIGAIVTYVLAKTHIYEIIELYLNIDGYEEQIAHEQNLYEKLLFKAKKQGSYYGEQLYNSNDLSIKECLPEEYLEIYKRLYK